MSSTQGKPKRSKLFTLCGRTSVRALWLGLALLLDFGVHDSQKQDAGAVRSTGLERRPEPWSWLHPLSWVALGHPLSLLLSSSNGPVHNTFNGPHEVYRYLSETMNSAWASTCWYFLCQAARRLAAGGGFRPWNTANIVCFVPGFLLSLQLLAGRTRGIDILSRILDHGFRTISLKKILQPRPPPLMMLSWTGSAVLFHHGCVSNPFSLVRLGVSLHYLL